MGNAQPLVEHGRVDATEVDGVDRIAVSETSQVRVRAVQAGLDGLAQKEYRGCGAVIGPTAAVLVRGP